MSLPPATTTATTVAEPRPGVVPLPRDDGTVHLVDPYRHTVDTVNMTAGMIWAHCDGATDVASITRRLAATFNTDEDTIAADVHHSIDDLRMHGLLRTGDDRPFLESTAPMLTPDPSTSGIRYVTPAPCSCGLDLDTLPWAGSLTVGVGDVRFAIRYDTDDTGAAVREAVRDWLVDDEAPPAYTVVLRPDDQPPDDTVPRNGLYEGRRLQTTTTEDEEILSALVHRVRSWEPLGPSDARLRAFAISGPAGTVVVPANYGYENALRNVAGEQGWSFLPEPLVVSADSNDVVAIVWGGGTTERLDRDRALGRLVNLAWINANDDAETFVDALDLLASSVHTVLTPTDQLTEVVQALVRRR